MNDLILKLLFYPEEHVLLIEENYGKLWKRMPSIDLSNTSTVHKPIDPTPNPKNKKPVQA